MVAIAVRITIKSGTLASASVRRLSRAAYSFSARGRRRPRRPRKSRVTVADVQGWRDRMMAETKAPKTLNRRISSLSSFYKYLAGAAAELRLPINVPNPAHAQFIARESSDPLEGTRALTATRARQLMGLPSGDEALDLRDRAILKTYLYTGIQLATACRLRVKEIRTANRPLSLSTRKATSTAPSAFISPPPRR